MYLLLHFSLSAAISLPTGATNLPPSFMQQARLGKGRAPRAAAG